ncbi:Putative nucleoside transporter YegT [Maioricimonas rarisocia]|uniref:Nucleoside transporter YegT n=1 Tax=Maioricimonas rarisocia TaxID=2528026 RepID=A0A517Z7V4_9PLAN|nr:MFS transporter [Maioricimonas rarisocia]QDU38558.1 Putative nucleoside transporter YegT [Maioricimonas rarisocia]
MAETLDAPGRTATGLKLRLFLMMFLQYFVQGSYLPVVTEYLRSGLGFAPSQLGAFGAAISIGPLVAPFFIGQLVDRHMATERVLAFCHFAGGIIMISLFFLEGFWPIFLLGAAYSALYVPSMMLTNSLTFSHLADREREFPLVRLWGTIGFVLPAWWVEMVYLKGLEGSELDRARGIVLMFAGVSGLLMAVYSLTLPHTPPVKKDQPDLAPGKVLQLLKLRHFAVLVGISLVVAVSHKYFFVWNSPYLRHILDQVGIRSALEGRISSIGQIAEVLVMTGLGWSIKRYGFKATMLAGVSAYLLRCLLFALAVTIEGGQASYSMSGWMPQIEMNGPAAMVFTLVAMGQALHGFCFGCFLATAYMYVDRVAPADVRGSMQTFYGTFIVGAGMFAGGFVGGWIGELFETSPDATPLRSALGVASQAGMAEFVRELPDGTAEAFVADWTGIWLSGALLAAVALIGMWLLFPRDAGLSEATEGEES